MKRIYFRAGQNLSAEHFLPPEEPIMTGQQPVRPGPEQGQLSRRFLVYFERPGPAAESAQTYAGLLAGLLKGQLSDIQIETGKTTPGFSDLAQQVDETVDLVIYGEPNQSWLKGWFLGPPACRVVAWLPASVLVARRPRWPLRHLLLVTRGQRMDNLAVAWLVCLARSSKATITVLALQPYLSLTDSQALYGHGLADWLWSDTPLGNQLRRLAGQPIHDDVQDWLQLQFLSESPERQIQQVVNDTQPDLIVIAADSADWWERRLLGELVNPLLHWADRPVLVAKPNMYGGEDKECQSS